MVRTWLKMTMARPPAASSAVPSRPIMTVSVVVRATWASWVRISGTASVAKARLSRRRMLSIGLAGSEEQAGQPGQAGRDSRHCLIHQKVPFGVLGERGSEHDGGRVRVRAVLLHAIKLSIG